MKKIARSVIAVLALFLCSSCVNGVFFQPNHITYQLPSDRGLKFERVVFPSRDGTLLTGWFVPTTNAAVGTVIQFHGNGQNMTAHFSYVDWLPAAGFNVFVFDYRGYGQSPGKPDRQGLFEDSVAALRYIQSRADIDTNRLFVLAQSLGGANAIAALAATDVPGVRAIAIDSSFYSYRSIVRDKIAMIPVLSLLRWPLSFLVVSNARSPGGNIGKLPRVPLLLIHGTADQVVPYHHAAELLAKAHEPKELWTVEGVRHTDFLIRTNAPYRQALVEFFKGSLDKPSITQRPATSN